MTIKIPTAWLLIGAAVVAASMSFFVREAESPAPALATARARAVSAEWSDSQRLWVDVLIERYGPPDSISELSVAWSERGPWKRVAVHRFPSESFLEHTVACRLSPERAAGLRAFNHGLTARTDELSARGDGEVLNFLVLNLAHEIAEGQRTPKEADDFFVSSIQRWHAGKSSPYMQGLLFDPARPVEGFSRFPPLR